MRTAAAFAPEVAVQTRARPSRIWTIMRAAARYRLDDLILPHSRSIGLRLLLTPLRLLPERPEPVGDRLRLAIEELGPVFIKFGQMLSTRHDLLTPALAHQLQALQDQVTPFDSLAARRIVEAELGRTIDDAFVSFETAPMASASVAQVHGAQLETPNGAVEDVIVKIVRPNLEPVIAEDIAILRSIARLVERHLEIAQRLHPTEIVDDYERTIFAELDLRIEAANTQRLRLDFANSDLLYVPRIYTDYCTANVMVAERIYGVPISDIAELKRRKTNLPLLAARGVETFFTQVFETNFFHADMHPGNIFVDLTDPDDPSYIAIDCAIVGSLTEADQDYLARNLFAFFRQDYAAVAKLHVESGWVPAETDPEAFEAVIRELCEPIFAKPLSEIVFSEFLIDLFQTASSFRMEVQPQLVLLQKTLLYIEGLGRQLYPELDLWTTAKPFMERWMAERLSPGRAVTALLDQAPQILEELPQLPELLATSGFRLKKMDNQLKRHAREIDRLTAETKTLRRRSAVLGGLLGLGLLLWVMFS
ncbi:MAG: ubiquinone biosynthesis regulatory protein kinase UbiB [Pseudomonadota bacterium]